MTIKAGITKMDVPKIKQMLEEGKSREDIARILTIDAGVISRYVDHIQGVQAEEDDYEEDDDE